MTHVHSSPWLAQLALDRPGFRLDAHADVDVAIVGAGIAGITTAYFLMKETNLRVALIDAGRIAHGATGHNAGQVVSYFERPLTELIQEFGVEKTAHAQSDIEAAWMLLDQIRDDCRLATPLYKCTGHAGFSTMERLIQHLEQCALRVKLGLKIEPVMVHINSMKDIPKEYHDMCMPMPHSSILQVLETDQSAFIAAITSQKGCTNSALFCEELAGYMTTMFGDRLIIAEHLPVETVELKGERAIVHTTGPNVSAGRVVLCTNGFESLNIENRDGPPIASSFYSLVQGLIGYMVGYLEVPEKPASAVSYYGKGTSHLDPYIYVTRRPFKRTDRRTRNLLCIGGPDRLLPDRATYNPDAPFPSDVEEELERSMEIIRPNGDDPPIKAFAWHGVMGYTRTGVRCIGTEPRNPALLYNLGCNGVGILPSIYGAKRIAQILKGKKLPPSIFDPVAESA